ncbi:hypothetical protein HRbin40_02144 [bacterium HR40]|nr:hypothetical protein HRbin40_02144 [bacterium HR40]
MMRRAAIRRHLLRAAGAILVVLLSACGRRGPLRLPEPTPSSPTAEEKAP